MDISKEQFLTTALHQGMSKEQAEAFWTELAAEDKTPAVSSFSKLLFYFGAMIIISAMTWLMNLSWEWFGGGGIFLISVAYATFFVIAGNALWKKKDLKIPAGLFITIAVCMTPLAIYGLETYFNVWPQEQSDKYRDFYQVIRGGWIFMELGTIVAGIIALRYFAFPFLTAPIFFSAWFLTMDLIPVLFGKDLSWEKGQWVSLFFGLVLIAISYVIDRKKLRDYAFWGYFFGTLAFWGSMTSLIWNKGEFVLFLYFVVNFLLMGLSIVLRRKVFMVFGALGCFIYLSHLAYAIFQNSILFPFVLSIIGLAIVYLGIYYQKNVERIEGAIASIIPEGIRAFFFLD